MAINSSRSLEVENGMTVTEENSTVEGPFYTGGPSSPVGLDLSQNTFYVQNTGDRVIVWQKFGAGVNDWVIFPASDVSFDPTGLVNLEPSDTDVQAAVARLGAQSLADLTRAEGFFFDTPQSTTSNGYPDINLFQTDISKPVIVGSYQLSGVILGGQSDKEKQFGYRIRSREVGGGGYTTRFQYNTLTVGQDGAIIPIPFNTVFDITSEQVQHEFLLEFGNTDAGGSALFEEISFSFQKVGDV